MRLEARQLRLWLEDVEVPEKELNCAYRGEPVQGHFVGVIEYRRNDDAVCWRI